MTEREHNNTTAENAPAQKSRSHRTRKLAPHFVDEITNITFSTNGAARIYFCTWSVDEGGAPIRIDSELIMTKDTLDRLATVLPEALAQSSKSPARTPDETDPPNGKGLFRNRKQ